MKTPKELDIVRRHEMFDDTPWVVQILHDGKMPEISRHVHKMYIYQKHLIAEVRKLRRELKSKNG
jgi:hypothetical protein